MSSTTTSDWNDAVAEVMAESGASKEAAEEALHQSAAATLTALSFFSTRHPRVLQNRLLEWIVVPHLLMMLCL
jgi:hypothetical protein